MGAIREDVMRGFVEDVTEPGGMSFACTDADTTYAAVFSGMNVPHYVRPSDYLDTLKAAGYEPPSKVDERKAAGQWERDQRILEQLWEAGSIDRIENRGKMTYREFAGLKEKFGLSLAAVNALHASLRKFVEGNTHGVSTKLLPLYLGFFEYVRNMGMDAGVGSAAAPVASRKDAERLLVAAVEARVNLTSADVAGMRAAPLPLEGPSGRYVHELARRTRAAREATGDETFRFGAEDGVESFNVRKLLRSLSDKELRTLGKQTALHDWRHRNRTLLIEGLAKMDGIEGILMATVVAKKRQRATQADAMADERARKRAGKAGPGNAAAPSRKVVKHTFTRSMLRRFDAGLLEEVGAGSLAGADGSAGAPVVFFDIETTGLRVNADEVLSLAVVTLDGEVLFENMFKPLHRRKWDAAQAVNGISPDDVGDCYPLLTYKPVLDEVFGSAGLIVGWNSHAFDTRMLYAGGIEMPRDAARYLDLMEEFASVWNAMPGRSRQQQVPTRFKLTEAAALLGLDAYSSDRQHTAAGDAAVLVDIWKWMAERV